MSLMKSDTDASLSRGTTEQGHSRGHKPGLRDVRPVLVPQPAQQISQIDRKTLQMLKNTAEWMQMHLDIFGERGVVRIFPFVLNFSFPVTANP